MKKKIIKKCVIKLTKRYHVLRLLFVAADQRQRGKPIVRPHTASNVSIFHKQMTQ